MANKNVIDALFTAMCRAAAVTWLPNKSNVTIMQGGESGK